MARERFVDFMIGEWVQFGIGILHGEPVEPETYNEKFELKDGNTLLVTHDCFGDWETNEMNFFEDEDRVKMIQGDLVAEGFREGNVYILAGKEDDSEIKFKLYMMGDKFIQHREVLRQGHVVQVDMSYLVRKKKASN
ncbi:MAG: hypothetical protein BM556_03540 [Bacteriovorax sp. MedPE-SWde]|nr:MAG: hypothetical protein BM556_03540 [Bacteriovorax sp. MedPE-SWde]